MKRFIVTPFEWGSQSGYDFLNSAAPEADKENAPHVSWSLGSIQFERSWRIWEPGRMALSSLGVGDPGPDNQFNVPQIPQGCKIHGIKGTLLIMPQKAAVFYDADTGETLDPQPAYDDIFAPEAQLYRRDDVDGNKFVPQQVDENAYPVAPSPGEDPPRWNTMQPQNFARCPFYITMYKGTYNPYGSTSTEGGDIDSGPSDDPDTLLGVDITNPTVLEQERIVWWDMVMGTAPYRNRREYPGWMTSETGSELRQYVMFNLPLEFNTHLTQYNLSLDRNWILRDDQVLWLHVMPGIVETPLFILRDTDTVRVAYKIAANYELVASMLATPFTPGK